MTIKVQCGCGTKYSFDVEPQNGVMPFTVNCPSCNTDGTAAANEMIAQTLAAAQPRLRMRDAPPSAAIPPQPAAEPADLPPPQRPTGAAVKRLKAESRQTRWQGLLIGLLLLIVLGLIGAWGWYNYVGSKPHLAYTVKLDASEAAWHTEFLPDGKILLAAPDKVILYDAKSQKNEWSTPLPGESADARAPHVYVDKQNIWVCPGDQLFHLDETTGQIKQTTPVAGQLAGFTPSESSLLIVSATSETTRKVMRVDLGTDDISSRDIEVPRSQKHEMPDELPANVAPTAGVLLAQATEEHKFNKPLDAISSEFFSAGQNLVELRVRLLEPKVEWVKSIKPRGPSLINGQTTASTSTAAVEEEVFNDIKRDQTGGVKAIDESLYEVRLRRWLDAGGKPTEWKGNVTGVPAFYSLPTVDLLVAGKSLTVFDKQNNELFETDLSYPISERFAPGQPGHPVPAVEKDGVLYFFDQGVLTALTLPGGQVQWRLTSIGISHVQFDHAGMMYVDTTAGTPEDIQYSEQIKFLPTQAVILKVDPRTGKILWQVQNLGQHCHLSGDYLYTVAADKRGSAALDGLAGALNSPQQEEAVNYHICRLDPATGAVIWRFYREGAPDEAAFEQNSFILRFGNELQMWKFLVL